jgi:hypothetical protein
VRGIVIGVATAILIVIALGLTLLRPLVDGIGGVIHPTEKRPCIGLSGNASDNEMTLGECTRNTQVPIENLQQSPSATSQPQSGDGAWCTLPNGGYEVLAPDKCLVERAKVREAMDDLKTKVAEANKVTILEAPADLQS